MEQKLRDHNAGEKCGLGGCLNDIELDVGADIEDHNFQRADLFFDLVKKSYDLVNKQ